MIQGKIVGCYSASKTELVIALLWFLFFVYAKIVFLYFILLWNYIIQHLFYPWSFIYNLCTVKAMYTMHMCCKFLFSRCLYCSWSERTFRKLIVQELCGILYNSKWEGTVTLKISWCHVGSVVGENKPRGRRRGMRVTWKWGHVVICVTRAFMPIAVIRTSVEFWAWLNWVFKWLVRS
jgi:hypothetical protein